MALFNHTKQETFSVMGVIQIEKVIQNLSLTLAKNTTLGWKVLKFSFNSLARIIINEKIATTSSSWAEAVCAVTHTHSVSGLTFQAKWKGQLRNLRRKSCLSNLNASWFMGFTQLVEFRSLGHSWGHYCPHPTAGCCPVDSRRNGVWGKLTEFGSGLSQIDQNSRRICILMEVSPEAKTV